MPVTRGKGKKTPPPKPKDPRELGKAILVAVDEMNRLKNIPREEIFVGMEAAIQMAAERSANGEENVLVQIDRTTGEIVAQCGTRMIDPEELGRIAAQSAKQVMIQKIREAEGDGLFKEFAGRKGEMVTGTVQRVDQGGNAIITLVKDARSGGTHEAILPRSEQIPGETHHVNERVKAVVMDVRRNGNRVKIVLSRCHPDFVRCLFETEIPEIADRTIEIKAVSREAGYRSKVAVASLESKVDCVGACVGVRGSRIKSIIDEINGERIDIVRWNDSMQVMIPNALQPAEISEVMIYHRIGRAIVLVTEDQLSLAIGRRGQNVRLASKLVAWDIEIMTHDELGEGVIRAERWFSQFPDLPTEGIENLITEGFLSYTDLTFLEPSQLVEMTGVTEEQATEIIELAEQMADYIEKVGDPTIQLEQEALAQQEASEMGEGGESLEGGESGEYQEQGEEGERGEEGEAVELAEPGEEGEAVESEAAMDTLDEETDTLDEEVAVELPPGDLPEEEASEPESHEPATELPEMPDPLR